MSTLNKIQEKIQKINIDQDLLYKKWNIQHRDELFTSAYWAYFPMTEKYFFEANPGFLYEYKNLFDFGRYPISLVRDGFLGILDFFLVHSKPPKDFTSIVLVPKKFERLVPKSWQEQVAVYEFFNKKEVPENKKEVIIYGSPTAEIFYQKDISDVAKWVCDTISDYKKYHLMIPIRDSVIAPEKIKKKMHFIEFLKELYRNHGFDIEIHHNEVDEKIKSFEGSDFDYCGLDQDKIFINDNFLDHKLSSFGGFNKSWKSGPGEGMTYALSGSHGIEINELSFEDNIFSEFYLNFKLTGSRTKSIYQVFESNEIREIYLKHFS